MGITFLADQIGSEATTSIAFNGNPLKLTWLDIRLFFSEIFTLPGTVLPWAGTRDDDELTATFANTYCLFIHGILIVLQLGFIVSVLVLLLPPFSLTIPVGIAVPYVVGFIICNWYICKRLLNGSEPWLESTVDTSRWYRKEHDEERWIFLNGVSVGEHWLKSNVNRIALTFGRNVLGVHNPTTGIVFDVLECLIQRCIGYATMDIRNAYVKVKEALYDPQYTKVVFIVHSQGAIEGSMIIDWLLDEVPRELLWQLEVYTFGNASNHFNDPHQVPYYSLRARARQNADRTPSIDTQIQSPVTNGTSSHSAKADTPKAIRHIEHYAHDGDFVARWGVLHFTRTIPKSPTVDRFMGRVFIRPASGHMLNQHYLTGMFPLNPDGSGTMDTNDFVEQDVEVDATDSAAMNKRVGLDESIASALDPSKVGSGVVVRNVGSPHDVVHFPDGPGGRLVSRRPKVKDVSRLWMYRNGQSPPR